MSCACSSLDGSLVSHFIDTPQHTCYEIGKCPSHPDHSPVRMKKIKKNSVLKKSHFKETQYRTYISMSKKEHLLLVKGTKQDI